MFDFTGKAVLVTGGGAGIGRATAEAFKAAGARVATIEIDPSRAEEARAALGDDALVVVGDVTDAAAVADLSAQVDAAFGGLDVLVNNVGDFLMLAKPFDQLSDAEIARLYATNLGQVFGVTRAMIPLLRRKGAGGSIVSVSSIEGFRGIPHCAVYAACKAGLTGFTQSLALELGPEGIRVNLIAPETTDTPQVPVSLMIPEEHRRHIPNWIPLGRFGTPQDMASGILFLASPHAAWITGTALHIDGGALAAAGWYRDPRGTWTNLPVLSGNGLNF
ncbi:glucose 1-dehydrogenase [Sphingomonas histidinilytica]|jgi:NAD(P)-dependent dehydrogenase (short-subunit alcohol dehydrogenase family)|uniref:NAD(P)-dependent dehydrogenase, short-chain alcohol dehydrogenase family n=1 Tax=Rhizorhabdus histidinilytica TaxID=439228 RepID=A0A1T5E1C2_9SPHN|nr:SDR family NAD(P)-dependent oxidoreductase [Rhizorhabdus histidinilytica]MBO9378023.1 glucose 1-dehydrogenase [Rhizorhabdus histidinilytica]QEH80728.1 SDR family oxidoreductase [Sphingomonas sp. C8-2]SKB77735.1 NAD(P)-dependent dehydrogenase, short-chain alcohol dehydrogenase family [Rhizorhabdus histidinilytica]